MAKPDIYDYIDFLTGAPQRSDTTLTGSANFPGRILAQASASRNFSTGRLMNRRVFA